MTAPIHIGADVLPRFPDFAPLAFEHQAIVSRIASNFLPYSDHNFTSYWCWRADDGPQPVSTQIASCNGNVVVRLKDYLTQTPILTFFGDRDTTATIMTLLEYVAAQPGLTQISLVPAYVVQSASLPAHVEVTGDRDNFDYVYDTAALAAMNGAPYQVHRTFVHRFKRQYDWSARPLDLANPQDWAALRTLFERWAAAKAAEGMSIESDRNALGKLPALIGRSQLFGLGLFVDGALCGYTINEQLHDGYSINLFEHADKQFAGIFRMLKQQTAIHLRDLGYRYWNHQQDSGLLGLRQSKTSFQPAFLLEKFAIKARFRHR